MVKLAGRMGGWMGGWTDGRMDGEIERYTDMVLSKLPDSLAYVGQIW